MYVTVEGPDHTGKSTIANMLASKLESEGYNVLLTKEPGSQHDEICKSIRKILLNPDHKIEKISALFLFLADRAQHIELIKKKLREGFIVISDRSSLSSFVYHTAESRGTVVAEEDSFLCSVLDFAQQVSPDLCYLCSADLQWAIDNLNKRSDLDRIERKPLEFHENVHSLFSRYNVIQMNNLLQFGPKDFYFCPKTSITDKNEMLDNVYKKFMEKVNEKQN